MSGPSRTPTLQDPALLAGAEIRIPGEDTSGEIAAMLLSGPRSDGGPGSIMSNRREGSEAPTDYAAVSSSSSPR
jgi:hypothetical protein